MCVMSQCKKFVPNIFHKTKCSNCFRQKEEHTAEALECNRASRSVARSGYLFVAPDWDFSVPLNRTKRWQRRWFVLYDDGELNYSVDEHPDTVPQGSVDMSKVLEVTGAEQVTGHPHSLALTSPDRVTFVKAASREDARWWAELLAVFPRRHKRNATFPGGRASPSLPQLGRSASPQPQRPRHLSCTGPSPRTNFTTPPLKEEREPPKDDANGNETMLDPITTSNSSITSISKTSLTTSTIASLPSTATSTTTTRPTWFPKPTNTVPIESIPRTDYHLVSSGSPPTRDKLRCDEKTRTRRDWRHERLRDIATDIITDRSPESSLALPAEGLLNLKKGWLWYKTEGEWRKRWWVLCGPTLNGYQDQDEHGIPEITVELSTVTRYVEVQTDFKYGFQIEWSGPDLILSAVTSGIRSNWLQALKKAAPCDDNVIVIPVTTTVTTPTTPRSLFLSSDEEYRTASEGGRRDSEDWSEIPSSPLPPSAYSRYLVKEKPRIRPKLPKSRHSTVDSVSTDELDTCREPDEEDDEVEGGGLDVTRSSNLTKNVLARKYQEKMRTRPKVIRCQSRHSTLDSVSTDELDACKEPEIEFRNVINKQTLEIENLRKKCNNAESEIQNLEIEISRLKKTHADLITREKQLNEMLELYEINDTELKLELKEIDEKHLDVELKLQKKLAEAEKLAQERKELTQTLQNELQTKELLLNNMQMKLNASSECMTRCRQENERLYKRIQEVSTSTLERSNSLRSPKRIDSLQDLTNIDLDLNLDELTQNELVEQFLDLRDRFEKAIIEIRAVKRELRESYVKFDNLELENVNMKRNVEIIEEDARSHSVLMANRVQDLTNKLAMAEKQARSLKAKLQHSRGKRRSLSLKGRENFSINKEVEDKVNELEAKILVLEKNRTRRKRRERSMERLSASSSPNRNERPPPHQQQQQQNRQSSRRKSLDSATTSEPMKLLMRLSNLESTISNVNVSNESLNILANGTPGTDSTKFDECLLKSIYLSCEIKLKECLDCVNLLKSDNRTFKSNELLNNLEQLLNDCCELFTNIRDDSETNAYKTSANNIVKQLTSLLNEKLSNINERKRVLREENNFSERKQMEFLAEKLAYENVIIDRIRQALETTMQTGETNCERYVYKEIIETKNLLNSLQNKLKGNVKKETHVCKTTAEHLAKILTNRLVLSNRSVRLKTYNLTPYVEMLLEEQNRMNVNLQTYKSKKLSQLADALANEALSLSTDTTCRLRQTTDDIWKQARETVNSELIQSEINHVLMKAAQTYETDSSLDQNCFFTFYASERAALELWTESVEDYLKDEMERNVRELTDLFKINLAKLQQRQNWRRRVENERTSKSINLLLSEYADIIAHKALIDARLYVLTDDGRSKHPEDILNVDNKIVAKKLMQQELFWYDMERSDLLAVDLNLEAEFKCMYESNKADCLKDVVKIELNKFKESLLDVAEDIYELNKLVNGEYCANVPEDCADLTKTCKQLRDVLYTIKNCLGKANYINNFKYEDDSLYLGAEYLNQVENLRSAYRRLLNDCENHKQQSDLEQLQLLCERVLIMMEHWHCKTMEDAHEEHAQELELLRQDKEQALAEETQATLAALDAMRKAHEADVKREVAKFKEDFQRKQQHNLLQLSERLSVKCLEAAALEEQLGSTTRQLAHAQQHILQLERNPQLSMQQN